MKRTIKRRVARVLTLATFTVLGLMAWGAAKAYTDGDMTLLQCLGAEVGAVACAWCVAHQA
jgi:hypothetical protein